MCARSIQNRAYLSIGVTRCLVLSRSRGPLGGAGPPLRGLYAASCKRTSENLPSETVWKFSDTGQAPHHQTDHGRVDERFCASTKSLVILAHPPVLAKPGEGSLHHPPARQGHVPSRRHQPLPVHLLAFLCPLPSPPLRYLLRYGLGWLAHDLHAQAHNLLSPPSAPALVSCVQPQVRKAREPRTRRLQ